MCRLSSSIGTTKSLSGSSCKRIKEQLSTDCNTPGTNGLYWVKGIQECTGTPVEPIMVRMYSIPRVSNL